MCEEGHEIQRRSVGPVQVLEHENDRSLGADTLEHVARFLEESELRVRAADLRRHGHARLRQLRNEARQLTQRAADVGESR